MHIPFALTHVFSEASVLIERTAMTVDLNCCSVDFFFFTDTVDLTSLSCLKKKPHVKKGDDGKGTGK